MTDLKKPFDIDAAMRLVREAIRPYPKAAMFALADEGYDSAFEQLIACIISIRTFDEVSLPCAKGLFALARTPHDMMALDGATIDAAIRRCTFHEAKTHQIRDIARQVVERYGGQLPCDAKVLLGFHGVGPKCANLALSIACGQPVISVDIHVHRVTNRWGYVKASSPERTMLALEAVLPKEHWVEINRLLVPFGKHICTGQRPRCSTCPLRDMCQQDGVTDPR
jgi:endonuclease-3